MTKPERVGSTLAEARVGATDIRRAARFISSKHGGATITWGGVGAGGGATTLDRVRSARDRLRLSLFYMLVSAKGRVLFGVWVVVYIQGGAVVVYSKQYY